MELARQQWFSDVFEAGLTHQFYASADVVEVAPPQLLAKHLPSSVLGRLLALAMKEKLTPDQVVSSVTARVIAKHVPEAVLWKCVAAAAGKAGVADGGATKAGPQVRGFLRASLESGLKHQVLRPEDVVRHVDARVLVDTLPHELTAKLLATSLESGTIDAHRVIEVVGIAALAQHAPTPLLWQCVAEVQAGGPTARSAAAKPGPAIAGAAPAASDDAADFHDAETDVRPAASITGTDLDMADMSDVEILEESVPPEPVSLEEDEKKGKRGGLFGLRKRS